MDIQIASDLHLEFSKTNQQKIMDNLWPTAEFLILAGDTLTFSGLARADHKVARRYHKFLKHLSSNWERVIMIPGNHEYYGSNYLSFRDAENLHIAAPTAGVDIVNREVLWLDEETAVVCATGWSYVTPPNEMKVQRGMNDFYQYKNFTVRDFNQEHKKDSAFIKGSLDWLSDLDKCKKVIVVTHHLPLYCLVAMRYASDPLTDAFASDLATRVDTSKVVAWIHGHSHEDRDVMIDGVRYVRNPLGYYPELITSKQCSKYITV